MNDDVADNHCNIDCERFISFVDIISCYSRARLYGPWIEGHLKRGYEGKVAHTMVSKFRKRVLEAHMRPSQLSPHITNGAVTKFPVLRRRNLVLNQRTISLALLCQTHLKYRSEFGKSPILWERVGILHRTSFRQMKIVMKITKLTWCLEMSDVEQICRICRS